MWNRRVSVCAPLVLLLIACGPVKPAASQSGRPLVTPLSPPLTGPVITIVSHSFAYTPQEVHVPRGQPFILTLDNQAEAIEHDLAAESLGGLHIHATPGKTAGGGYEVAAPAGRYPFWCTIPGHREAGMTGTIVVD